MININNCIGEKNTRNTNDGSSPTSEDGQKKTYYFKENYINEHDAFLKYYEAINKNGYIDSIIDEVQRMDDFCDLCKNVYRSFKQEELNNIHEPLSIDERNNSILYASGLVGLEDSRDKGRKLVAKELISRNRTIINEYPTILQVKPLCTCAGGELSPLYRCHNCGMAVKLFFSCDGCNVCIFCSRYCLSVAYKNYHRYECYGLQRHLWSMADTDYSYLAFRMMLYGATKNFETEAESCTYGSFSNNYPFINSLETNFDRIPLPVLNEILYSSAKTVVYLILKTKFFEHVSRNNIMADLHKYIGGLIVKHHCQAQINNILLSFPNYCIGFGIDGRWMPTLAGKAICPTISLLNHSCSPNAVIIVYTDFIAVKSLRNIKRGEEITICYAEVNPYLQVTERQLVTEEIFYFTCHCTFCEFERDLKEAPFRCLKCPKGNAKEIPSPNGSGSLWAVCNKCHQEFSIDEHIHNLKLASICRGLYEKTFSIEHLTKLAEFYNKLFPKNSPLIQEIYKNLLDKHVLWGKYPIQAMKYGLLAFHRVEKHIPRLYVPNLIAKFNFMSIILDMKDFDKIIEVTPDEYDTVNLFVTEVLNLRNDLLFYLPLEKLHYLQRIQCKVHDMFQNLKTKSSNSSVDETLEVD